MQTKSTSFSLKHKWMDMVYIAYILLTQENWVSFSTFQCRQFWFWIWFFFSNTHAHTRSMQIKRYQFAWLIFKCKKVLIFIYANTMFCVDSRTIPCNTISYHIISRCAILYYAYKKRRKRFNPFSVNTSKCDLAIEHLGIKNNTIINKIWKQIQRRKQY